MRQYNRRWLGRTNDYTPSGCKRKDSEMSELTFATEAARAEALEKFDETIPGASEKLEEIRGARIGEPDTTQQAPVDKPTELKVPEVKTEPTLETDFAGHKSLPDLIKSHRELEETLGRQGNKIRELLDKQPHVDNTVLQRAEKAERELAELKKIGAPLGDTTTDITKLKSDVKRTTEAGARIQSLIDELDQLADKDPESVLDSGYQKKMRELQRLQHQNSLELSKGISDLTELYNQASGEITRTKRTVEEFSDSQTKEKESTKASDAMAQLYKSMDELDDKEYKLPKPAKELEGEYIKWARDVALAYYDRPASDWKEINIALEQLQVKNPDLMQKCQLLGTKTEPTEGLKVYLKHVELLNFMDGYRKDPATGRQTRLMKYDPITRQQVPILQPDIKTALRQKRLEEGYYDKQADGAYQRGAEAVANVALRRDQGAITLDGGADQGQMPQDHNWAAKVLNEFDDELAMIEYRHGNTTKVDEFNKARKLAGLEPVTF